MADRPNKAAITFNDERRFAVGAALSIERFARQLPSCLVKREILLFCRNLEQKYGTAQMSITGRLIAGAITAQGGKATVSEICLRTKLLQPAVSKELNGMVRLRQVVCEKGKSARGRGRRPWLWSLTGAAARPRAVPVHEPKCTKKRS